MKNYRVKEIDGKFYPQERFFFFFWDNIKLADRASRDWFVTSAENNCYDGTPRKMLVVVVQAKQAPKLKQIAKDAWGTTNWIQPEFNTLGRAKLFIEEYKKFLERKYEKQKAKYYY